MLHRSFKPAKCKTALKLAVSRIKLMKNKKDGQVRQIRRELAQLIESGQYRTARIRVEHVLREEKTRAAYELIEIYCELISARLPVIESQKNCPIDLKEAIASVIFASPRCDDLPELMDIRKHFTAKYGKEFVNAAIELRPDSGVSRMLIEKLSTKSPDGPTKMKILAGIAEEHKVKWDPEAFEEKPPEDLLNGANTFSMASQLEPGPPPPNHGSNGPPNVQVPSSSTPIKAHFEPSRGPPPPDQPPNVQVPRRTYEYHDGSMNSNEQVSKSSSHIQDSASKNVFDNKATKSEDIHPEARTFGVRTDRIEMHAFPGDENAPGRQNWNVQFKDAASAAQAAADSAERASMAARAAAELSRQYSEELRSKINQAPSVTTSTTSVNNDHLVNSLHMADPYPQKESLEHERRDVLGEVSMKKQSGSPQVMHGREMEAGVKHENTPDFGDIRSENKASRTSSPSNPSIGSDQGDFSRENDINYFADISTGTQYPGSSSPSHSRSFSNNQDIVSSFPVEDSYVSDVNIHQSTIGMNSEGNAPLVFDDSGSDDDDHRGKQSSLFFSSPGENSANLDPWSFEQKTDERPFKSVSHASSSSAQVPPAVFSDGLTGSTLPSEPNSLLPVTFDASDGPSSDSEEEIVTSKHVLSTDSRFPHENNVLSTRAGKSQNASHRLLASSSYEEAHRERSQGVNYSSVLSEKSFGYDDSPTSQPSPRRMESGLGTNFKDDVPPTMKDAEVSNECTCVSDTDNEFNPGLLKGGLRNKGFMCPPYGRNPSGNSHLDKQVTEDTPTVRSSVISPSSSEQPYSTYGTKLNKEQSTYVAPDDDSSEDELSLEILSSRRQDLYNQKSASEAKTSSRSKFSYFSSEDSEPEEDPPRKIGTSNAPTSTKFSRRTQPSSNSVRSSGIKKAVKSDAPRTSDYGTSSSRSSGATENLPEQTHEWHRPVEQTSFKPIPESKKYGNSVYESSTRSSYATETLPSALSQTKSSERSGSQEWEQAAPKLISKSKRSSRVQAPKSFAMEESSNPPSLILRSERTEPNEASKSSGTKSFGREQFSNPPPKIERSESSEDSKPSGYMSLAREQPSNPLPEVVRSGRTGTSKFSPPKIERSESTENSKSSGYKSFAREQPSNPLPEVVRSERTGTSKFSPPKSFTREQPSNLQTKIVRSASSETPKFSPPKSFTREQRSSPPKIVRSESTETSKSSSSAVESSSKGKASHVHPKLPDSDDFFGKFMALKQNRQ